MEIFSYRLDLAHSTPWFLLIKPLVLNPPSTLLLNGSAEIMPVRQRQATGLIRWFIARLGLNLAYVVLARLLYLVATSDQAHPPYQHVNPFTLHPPFNSNPG